MRVTGDLITNARGAEVVPRYDHVQVNGNAEPLFSLKRLHLSQFTGFDPNVRLAAAASDGGEGTGWSISLTGGLGALTDPLDGAYFVAPLSSIFGTKLASTTLEWTVQFQVVERTSPGNSTDYNVALGLMNETQDSATVEAIMNGLRYLGNRNGLSAKIENGTASTQTGGGGSTIRSCIFPIMKIGLGSTARLNSIAQFTVDSSFATVASGTSAVTTTVTNFGDGEPYLVAAFYRSAVTVGTATGAFDLYAGVAHHYRVSS